MTVLPATLIDALRLQIKAVDVPHRQDLADGFGRVHLPHALAIRSPDADRFEGGQYVFPAPMRAVAPRSVVVRRHHLAESTLQKMVKGASRRAGLTNNKAQRTRPRTTEHERRKMRGPWPGSAEARG